MWQDYKWLIQIVNQSLAFLINALTSFSNQWWEHLTAHTVLQACDFSRSQCCDASLTDLKSSLSGFYKWFFSCLLDLREQRTMKYFTLIVALSLGLFVLGAEASPIQAQQTNLEAVEKTFEPELTAEEKSMPEEKLIEAQPKNEHKLKVAEDFDGPKLNRAGKCFFFCGLVWKTVPTNVEWLLNKCWKSYKKKSAKKCLNLYFMF